MNRNQDTPSPLVKDWTFVPSSSGFIVNLQAAFARAYTKPRPPHHALKQVRSYSHWLAYFLFLPDGKLGSHHLFTLQKLNELDRPLFIVCATPTLDMVPPELHQQADALYWKGLSGYDFSAYTLILEAISQHSSGGTALIMNDSMFGPFSDLEAALTSAPWDLTGFTASGLNGNHIQSYAFILKDVTPSRLECLRDVFPAGYAFDNVDAVIRRQEIRMARVAHRHMSVGAYFYTDGKAIDDPCLRCPFELLDAGFPFMKRSLLGKMSAFQPPQAVIQRLSVVGHPIPESI